MQQPPANAAQCRERARRCFERAVAEENITAREAYLREGEAWMLRWRRCAPPPTGPDRRDGSPAG